jgi:4-amino-4-deoxy-L-arabinose transferase-like glycosyltransferase
VSTVAAPHLPTTGARGRLRARALSLPRPRPELAALLVLAGLLNLWALSRNGWANEYYSAAVRSMASSWHAFLYGSFDPAGVMTVDKPPLASWVQVAFVKVFGFHAPSLLVPQALMGVAAVALVYDLVRRRFGRAPGFVAGLVLATTPITVAISRHNNPDALLILCSVAALWFVVRALEDGRTRWLIISGVCVGLGFETKMAAALLVVPAIAAAYLWVAPRGHVNAAGQLVAGGAAMVAVGMAWPLLFLLTPAADRPWVSGTSDNSILSLIVGYNGLGRVDGQAGGPQSFGGAGGPGGGGGAGSVFGGDTGPFRLLGASLGGQAGWILGFAVVGGVAILVASRLRRADARTGWLIAVGGAFATTAVTFSSAKGIFHPYYVSLLAPFSAALVGAGAGHLRSGDRLARVFGPLAVAAGVATTLAVIASTDGAPDRVQQILLPVGVLGAIALALKIPARVRTVALAAVLGALLLAPATWAVQTLGHTTSGTFPAGGLSAQGFGGPGGGPGGAGRGGFRGGRFAPGALPSGGGFAPPGGSAQGGSGSSAGGPGPGAGGGPFGGDSTALDAAVTYATAHGGGTIAVSSQQGAAGTIIAGGTDVAALGGFSGRESEVSVAWLADAVRAGRIRWVLTDGSGGGFGGNDGRVGSSTVMAAVAQTCTPVSSASSSSTTTSGLYDCRGKADALAALAGNAS